MYGSEGFCFSSPYIWCVLPALCIMNVLFFFLDFDSYFLDGPLGDGPSHLVSVSHLCVDKIPRISCTSPEDLQRTVWHGSWDGFTGFCAGFFTFAFSQDFWVFSKDLGVGICVSMIFCFLDWGNQI